MSISKYRPDIDGLRAVSVLAVIVFHYYKSLLPGGYAGVDVFFVISGFLIASIVYRELEQGSFSLGHFWMRRIRRIAPALLVCLSFSAVIGYFYLTFYEFKNLSRSIYSSLLFFQNFNLYWQGGNYFQTNVIATPLLHLWSLSIEEQFYIFFPLLIWLLARLRINLFSFFGLGALLSLAASMYLAKHNFSGSYYFPQARFWEISAGICLAYVRLYHRKKLEKVLQYIFLSGRFSTKTEDVQYGEKRKEILWANIFACIGLVLLAATFFLLREGKLFKGLWAVPVVLGTLCLLWDERSWIHRHILSNPLAVWLGKISYPLYLWHWLLLSFANILLAEYPSRILRLVLLAASIVLSALCYYCIERPIRGQGKKSANKTKQNQIKIITLVCCSVLLAGLSLYSYREKGLFNRTIHLLSTSKEASLIYSKMIDDMKFGDPGCKTFDSCESGTGDFKVLFIGDSHMRSLYNIEKQLAENVGFHSTYISINAMNPLGEGYCDTKKFRPFYRQAREAAVDEVFITGAWFYLNVPKQCGTLETYRYNLSYKEIIDTIRPLLKDNIHFTILADIPVSIPGLKGGINKLIRYISQRPEEMGNYKINVEQYHQQAKEANRIFRRLVEEYPEQITFLDPTSIYCPNGVCHAFDIKNQRFYYLDNDHQSQTAGAMRLYPMLKEYFEKRKAKVLAGKK